MKKIIALCLAVIMMFSMTACSSLSEEEKAFTGLWNATYVEMDGTLERVPNAYCALEVKEDKTATISVIGENGEVMPENLTWVYVETSEGGLYVYEMTNSVGGIIPAAYSVADEKLVLLTAENASILFEKIN
ncbi:MAG: hypothetical protein IKU54_05110 [Oscillospiraceae bacterium]|nr:hypothetical protein [Oscillospiraceae bacterium]